MNEESLLEWFLRIPIKELYEEMFGDPKGSVGAQSIPDQVDPAPDNQEESGGRG